MDLIDEREYGVRVGAPSLNSNDYDWVLKNSDNGSINFYNDHSENSIDLITEDQLEQKLKRGSTMAQR